MSNPRPCKCGHNPSSHKTGPDVGFRPCQPCRSHGRFCVVYSPAKRTEPLQAQRTWTMERLRATWKAMPGLPKPGETIQYRP